MRGNWDRRSLFFFFEGGRIRALLFSVFVSSGAGDDAAAVAAFLTPPSNRPSPQMLDKLAQCEGDNPGTIGRDPGGNEKGHDATAEVETLRQRYGGFFLGGSC